MAVSPPPICHIHTDSHITHCTDAAYVKYIRINNCSYGIDCVGFQPFTVHPHWSGSRVPPTTRIPGGQDGTVLHDQHQTGMHALHVWIRRECSKVPRQTVHLQHGRRSVHARHIGKSDVIGMEREECGTRNSISVQGRLPDRVRVR